jgi:hypothetical protein
VASSEEQAPANSAMTAQHGPISALLTGVECVRNLDPIRAKTAASAQCPVVSR